MQQLNPREVAFLRAYVGNGGNGTRAAVEAGVPSKDAAQAASIWLQQPHIRTPLEAAQATAAAQLQLDAGWVLEQLRDVYEKTAALTKVLDQHGQPTGELRFDAANSLKALALIGKHRAVQAFDVKPEAQQFSRDLLERLQRGRARNALRQAPKLPMPPAEPPSFL